MQTSRNLFLKGGRGREASSFLVVRFVTQLQKPGVYANVCNHLHNLSRPAIKAFPRVSVIPLGKRNNFSSPYPTPPLWCATRRPGINCARAIKTWLRRADSLLREITAESPTFFFNHRPGNARVVLISPATMRISGCHEKTPANYVRTRSNPARITSRERSRLKKSNRRGGFFLFSFFFSRALFVDRHVFHATITYSRRRFFLVHRLVHNGGG